MGLTLRLMRAGARVDGIVERSLPGVVVRPLRKAARRATGVVKPLVRRLLLGG